MNKPRKFLVLLALLIRIATAIVFFQGHGEAEFHLTLSEESLKTVNSNFKEEYRFKLASASVLSGAYSGISLEFSESSQGWAGPRLIFEWPSINSFWVNDTWGEDAKGNWQWSVLSLTRELPFVLTDEDFALTTNVWGELVFPNLDFRLQTEGDSNVVYFNFTDFEIELRHFSIDRKNHLSAEGSFSGVTAESDTIEGTFSISKVPLGLTKID